MNLWDRMSSFVVSKVEEKQLSEKQVIDELKNACIEIDQTFYNYEIIDPKDVETLKDKYKNLYFNATNKSNTFKALFKRDLKNQIQEFITIYVNIDGKFESHNEYVSSKRISEYQKIINPVEGRNLDKQQLTSIVKDSHNHLILAGAGTGKTTTIIGYIKYLLSVKNISANEILVLSFTNASACEMSKRIEEETLSKLDALTFHKLGMKIITDVENKKPAIYTGNIRQKVKEELTNLCKDQSYMRKLCQYVAFYGSDNKSEFEFECEEEYYAYLKANPPKTLKGEIVKSYGELMVANYLYLNGISYEYETPYKFETVSKEYSQYKPDFYLPEFDIYIEYYGIDRQGNVASYFNGRDGKSASEAYNESINWKRKQHKKNKTNCIELFSYEHFENCLLDNLTLHLNEYNVKFKPKPIDEIWKSTSDSQFDSVIDLFVTIINLLKSNDCDFDELRKRNNSLNRPIKIDIIIDLIKPIFDYYQKLLKDSNQIDFNDMVSKATKYIEDNNYIHNYKYVIIDEYQDMAQSRFKLLYAMRVQKDFSLFCVGDDWQSIYRFSGSDIGFILAFEKYWGPTMFDRIETTYRFTQSLIEISGNFIMKNPYQIKKNLKSKQSITGFSCEEIQGFNSKYAIQFMESSLNNLEKNATVFFLGRYTFDVKLLNNNTNYDYYYDNKTGKVIVIYKKRRDLDISFVTAHASKGLQADYVYIINNKDKGLGFPSRISDAQVLKLLLDNTDNYPFAEERRLFYVALTRAKKKVYLLTEKNNESIFVKEIKEIYGKAMVKEKYTCPECGGRLIKKHGKYGDFLGCSNYKNGCRYIKKLS